MAYREDNGKRYENPHAKRLDSITQAEQSKEALTSQEGDTLAFIYTKEDPLKTLDPDKVRYLKTKPSAKDLNPETTGDNSIYEFSGEYKFLSPLHKSDVQAPGDATRTYPSVEHALAASKTNDTALKDAILAEEDPVAAKRIGSKALASDKAAAAAWREGSLKIMGCLLRDKFKRGPAKYRERLLATKHRNLVYCVSHNDQFWGVVASTGGRSGGGGGVVGNNHFGKLLMEVRTEIRDGKDTESWLQNHFSLAKASEVAWRVEVTRGGKRIPEDDVEETGEAVLYCGKLSQCAVRAEHPTCSRLHAAFVADRDRGLCVVDLGTQNGTFVSGERLKPFTATPLKHREGAAGEDGDGKPASSPPLVTFAHSTRAYAVSVTLDGEARRQANLYSRLAADAQAKVNAQQRSSGSGGALSGAGGVGLGLSGEQTEHTAFLANLPFSVTEKSLLAWMVETNPALKLSSVSRVSVPMSKDNPGEARGIAFVSFVSAGALLQCVALDGDLYGERTVKVKKAKAAQPDKKPVAPAPAAGGAAPRAREGEYWKGKTGDRGGVCFDFQRGACTRGSACRFAHEVPPPTDEHGARGRGEPSRARPRADSGDSAGASSDESQRRERSRSRERRRRRDRSREHRRERSRSRERRRERDDDDYRRRRREDDRGPSDRDRRPSPGRRSRSPKRHRRSPSP